MKFLKYFLKSNFIIKLSVISTEKIREKLKKIKALKKTEKLKLVMDG